MHITTLRTQQIFRGYLAAGSKIHLTAGTICLREAASWGDAHAFVSELVLDEGASYLVQRHGWLQIQAKKDTEFLLELPETALLRRLWHRFTWRTVRRMTQVFG
ncbi:hypothetical protein BH11PSE12_BH11PSE12_06410 [soil metagenome]